MITRKTGIIAVTACLGTVGIFALYGWHYRRSTWPAEIQISVLGAKVAGVESLVKQEGYSHYGEGVFEWRYRVNEQSNLMRGLCEGKSVDECTFTKTRNIDEGVQQTVQYSDGLLIVVEEWK